MLCTFKKRVSVTLLQLIKVGKSSSSRAIRPETQLKHSENLTLLRDALLYNQGQRMCGFTVQEVCEIDELQMVAILLSHDKTGAQHLHLARDDPNNTFSVMFRTTPMDSTGVAHILEHTVLCGSESYPVRDPFFKMLNRSLATFMNAFTASDWTMYPFSTQNTTDFDNLLHVYLDAVFHPKLSHLDFLQEGWRLEHEDVTEPKSDIIFKGVVYNEMKGVFSNPQNTFVRAVQRALLPSHTYSVESGGDPSHITDLTWSQLKEFHRTHYNPSNARFLTYGDRPLNSTLEVIDSEFLSKFEAVKTDTKVPLETRWTSPNRVEITCRPEPMSHDPDKQTTLAVSFMLADIRDVYESFVLNIISTLLVDGETSPFYHSLLEANIGSDYPPVVGYQGETRNAYFTIGLQGIHSKDCDKVEQIIKETLDQAASEGFEKKRIEALLHRIELTQKHQTTNFGLNLALAVSSVWNHDGNVVDFLQTSSHVQKFREDLKKYPNFIQQKIEQHFKNNTHQLTLVMSPDCQHQQIQASQEHQKLQKVITRMSDSDPQHQTSLIMQAEELASQQNKKVDPSCLPTIKVEDLDANIQCCPVLVDQNVQYCVQPTNGVTYFKALFDGSLLNDHQVDYLSLFCNLVTRMSTSKTGYKDLSQRIEMTTGGLEASYLVSEDPSDLNRHQLGVVFSSYCLDKNIPEMLTLWQEIFNLVEFEDEGRLVTLIQMCAADLANSIVNSGHSFAMMDAASSLLKTNHLKQRLQGLRQVKFMKDVAQLNDFTQVKNTLQEIAKVIIDAKRVRYAVNTSTDRLAAVSLSMQKFVQEILPPETPGGHQWGQFNLTDNIKPLSASSDQQGCVARNFYTMPFSVHFAGQAYRTVPYNHLDFARLRVLASLMSSKFLHKEIREKGGAYGGGASGHTPGLFQLYSYRDPKCLETVTCFKEAIDWAAQGSFSQGDIEEAKLSVFQKLDMPIAPSNKGMSLFLNGITDEMRQTHRQTVLDVQGSHLQHSAIKYLSSPGDDGCHGYHATTILGPENSLLKESQSKWTINTTL